MVLEKGLAMYAHPRARPRPRPNPRAPAVRSVLDRVGFARPNLGLASNFRRIGSGSGAGAVSGLGAGVSTSIFIGESGSDTPLSVTEIEYVPEVEGLYSTTYEPSSRSVTLARTCDELRTSPA